MQKAAASASEFGLSFEWLGAYIATISEKTREAPEVIGTSLNSLMGRLHSIKQMGYNEEDETKVNDVAKALNAVNIALFDSEGQWRDMNLIFDEIAAKWNDMDDKQRAYISTTLAGTRQQNRFITLMSDMALGLEGGSRAYTLYEQAMNSAGVAAQKYAIYQETVQAAQDRLTVSLQDLYDTLVNGSMMKDFYNAMSGMVDTFTAGTEAMDAWNIKLPLLAAAVASVVAIAVKLKGVVEAIQAQGLLTSLTG